MLKIKKTFLLSTLGGLLMIWLMYSSDGRVITNHSLLNFTPLNNTEALRNVLPGGKYIPSTVTSRDRTAIIVPYRDRERHRDIFLRHMHSFLQKQQLNYMIIFVEMALPTTFNRGLLANVGFSIAKQIGNFTCFVFHDVDTLPTNEKLRYTCNDSIYHLNVANSKYQFRLPYKRYTGGVIAFPGALYEAINGFSNAYFGWGGEDDDLTRRIYMAKLQVKRPQQHVGRYYALNHTKDKDNPLNIESISLCNHCCGVHWLHHQLGNSADPDETAPAGTVSSWYSLLQVNTGDRGMTHTVEFDLNDTISIQCRTSSDQHDLLCTGYTRWTKEGLSSVQFIELKRESRQLYTWLYVDVNETSVMESIPKQYVCPTVMYFLQYSVLVIGVIAIVVYLKGKLRTM